MKTTLPANDDLLVLLDPDCEHGDKLPVKTVDLSDGKHRVCVYGSHRWTSFERDYNTYYDQYSNNSHKYSETGVIYFYFGSFGDWDYGDSSIAFDSLYGAYTGGWNESSLFMGRYFYSESWKNSLGGEGYDSYLGGYVPVTGSITETGSGILIGL